LADKLTSPLILKYQKEFEEKPHSRVFVPLAESYRKVGLVEKAIDFLRQGLEFHPNYVTAHVVLGNCYYDLKQHEKALRILSPLFEKGSENLKLLRLLSKSHYELNNFEDSKKFLKYLLFLNPNDEEVIGLLEKIEDRVPEQVLTDEQPSIQENRFNANIQNEIFKEADEWVRVDAKTSPVKEEKQESNANDWSVGTVQDAREAIKEELPTELSLDLVNIYQSQGLFERALDILDEYLKVHPKKEEFIRKRDELLAIQENKRPVFETKTLDELPDEQEIQSNNSKTLDEIPNEEEPEVVAQPAPRRGEAKTARLNSFLSAVKKRAESRKVLN
jgi:tetratricopeptide (TPR) repeat protein